MQKSLWLYTTEILHRGLKSLDKLDIIEEAERVVIANTTLSTSNLCFPEISLDSIKIAAF